jgi:hypothetical protein
VVEHCKITISKHQISGCQGLRFQVSGKRKIKGKILNLNTETLVIVICNFWYSSTPKALVIFTSKTIEI